MTEDVQNLLNKGRRSLAAARRLLRDGDCDFAASRAYYAMLYHAEALLRSEAFEADSHAGVIALLHREFVRTGRLDRAQAAAIERAWKERAVADYAAGTEFSEARAQQAVARAEAFLRAVEAALGA